MWVLAAILGIAKIPLDNMGPYTDYPGPPQPTIPPWLSYMILLILLTENLIVFITCLPLKFAVLG